MSSLSAPAAVWLLLLFVIGLRGHLRVVSILLLVPILAFGGYFVLANQLSANEDTDQSGVGAMIMAGVMLFFTGASLIAVATGACIGWVYRKRTIPQEN